MRKADVVVVGAGLAGLAAAREIERAGRSAVVVEARRRVGGRVLGQPIGGEAIELGGQWVGPTQDALLGLARELGVPTFKTYNEGNNVYYRNGIRLPYSSGGPLGPVPPDPSGAADAQQALTRINQMASQVPRESPWTAPNAEAWDSQTVETWKRDNLQTDGGRFLIDVAVEAVFAAEPRDLSFLFLLHYVACAGNERTPGTIERLVNTAGGAQESRFVGGSHRVPQRMARELGRRQVALGHPVRRIAQSRSGVRVECDRLVVRGKRAIVAMPPSLAGRIAYAPKLPALRDQLTQRVPNGSVIKCEAIYDRPFWRDAGLTGQVVSDGDPVRITFDNSPPDGSPGVLLGFIEGQAARRWGRRPAAERRRAVLENLATYFGPRALSPTAYYERDWSRERWTRGCYTGFMQPGALLDFGTALRRPFRRIHWAGTETATLWTGYMDGAVRSGRRAAREALEAL